MQVTWGPEFNSTVKPVDKQALMLDKVQNLKKHILALPQYEPITDHYFHGGMYCRKVFRHAGVCLVGKVHKKEHFYIVVSGKIIVSTDDGTKELKTGDVICCKPGTQRAVLALTDAVCVTVHRTDKTTVEDVEKECVVYDPDSAYIEGNKLKLKEIGS